MQTPIISFNSKTAPDNQPSIVFHSHPDTATDSTNSCILRIQQALKDHPSQFANVLALEIRNLLGHISLSVEIMETAINDNDEKTCLDVIARSSLRINNLIKEFLVDQQINEIIKQADCNRVNVAP